MPVDTVSKARPRRLPIPLHLALGFNEHPECHLASFFAEHLDNASGALRCGSDCPTAWDGTEASTQPLWFCGSWQAVGSGSGTDFQERASQPAKRSAALVAYAD